MSTNNMCENSRTTQREREKRLLLTDFHSNFSDPCRLLKRLDLALYVVKYFLYDHFYFL